jgi:hypothetical protein
MRAWALLLGGLIIWAAHFFILYAIASIFLTTTLARLLAGAVTLICLVAVALLLARALRWRADADPFEHWMHVLAALVAAISLVAVLWQGLPVLLA